MENDIVLTMRGICKSFPGVKSLNDAKQIISVEKGFDAREITEEDIATYGLGE